MRGGGSPSRPVAKPMCFQSSTIFYCSFTKTQALQSCISCTVIFCARTTVNVASFALWTTLLPRLLAIILRLPFCHRAEHESGHQGQSTTIGTVAAAAASSHLRGSLLRREILMPAAIAQEMNTCSIRLTLPTKRLRLLADCVSEISKAAGNPSGYVCQRLLREQRRC